MFTLTVFKILLFKARPVLGPAQPIPERETVKIDKEDAVSSDFADSFTSLSQDHDIFKK